MERTITLSERTFNLVIADELERLPREELVALARKAKGSLKFVEGETAASLVRKMRDEWEDEA